MSPKPTAVKSLARVIGMHMYKNGFVTRLHHYKIADFLQFLPDLLLQTIWDWPQKAHTTGAFRHSGDSQNYHNVLEITGTIGLIQKAQHNLTKIPPPDLKQPTAKDLHNHFPGIHTIIKTFLSDLDSFDQNISYRHIWPALHDKPLGPQPWKRQ